MKTWMNGHLVAPEEARVSVLDHGLLYGDGLFEGIRLYGGRVFRLHDHLARLEVGAKTLGIELPGGLTGLAAAVRETCKAHGEPEAYVRLVVTRGVGALGVDPTHCEAPQVFCIADRIALFPEAKRARGIDMITSSYRKPGPDVLDPRVKSLNYLNSVLAKQEAKRRGADEALVLNGRGLVAEASVANVFVVRGGKLITPPCTDGALEGITRDSIIRLSERLSIPLVEASIGRFDLLAADEVFLTGTGARIVPVATLDGAPVGRPERPVMARLSAAFEGFVQEHGVAL